MPPTQLHEFLTAEQRYVPSVPYSPTGEGSLFREKSALACAG